MTIKAPYYPIIYVRGYAATMAEVEETVATPYMGFNLGSTKIRQNFDDKIGLKHVDSFSSKAGIPIYKNHDYEVVSIYNNTSGVNQDSMAVMYLYLLEKDFQKPQ